MTVTGEAVADTGSIGFRGYSAYLSRIYRVILREYDSHDVSRLSLKLSGTSPSPTPRSPLRSLTRPPRVRAPARTVAYQAA